MILLFDMDQSMNLNLIQVSYLKNSLIHCLVIPVALFLQLSTSCKIPLTTEILLVSAASFIANLVLEWNGKKERKEFSLRIF